MVPEVQRTGGHYIYNSRRFVPLKYPQLNEVSHKSNLKLRQSTSKEAIPRPKSTSKKVKERERQSQEPTAMPKKILKPKTVGQSMVQDKNGGAQVNISFAGEHLQSHHSSAVNVQENNVEESNYQEEKPVAINAPSAKDSD